MLKFWLKKCALYVGVYGTIKVLDSRGTRSDLIQDLRLCVIAMLGAVGGITFFQLDCLVALCRTLLIM